MVLELVSFPIYVDLSPDGFWLFIGADDDSNSPFVVKLSMTDESTVSSEWHGGYVCVRESGR